MTVNERYTAEDSLKLRTKEFATRIMRLVDSLQNGTAEKVLANQLLRSGTSVAVNYRSLCRANSLKDFINKTSIIEAEADETAFWLELLIETDKVSAQKVTPLLTESNELVAIFVASRKTAQARQTRDSKIATRR
ncbi:MAG: four helix bundle protein [Chthoniobacterales bacterium]